MNRSELEELRQLSAAVGVKLPRSMNNSRTEREFFDKKGSMGVYFGRRCLQCLTALPVRARKDQRFCCNACKCASWRFIGGIREFEHRYGEGAVLHRAQRWAIALIGGRLGDMTDGHDLIYRRSPHEAAARRKRIYGSARYKPRQPGEMTWVEYKAQMERDEAAKKLEPFAGKPKKRRAGPGCRYKPAAPKWKPAARDVDTTFRGSSWSA